jgi:hypothetical protein
MSTAFPAPGQQAVPGAVVTGIPAYGTLIQVLTDAGPPEVYQSIAGITDIAGPNAQMAEIDTTSHSTGVPVRSFIPSLADPGDLTFPCFWNPTDPTQSVNSPYGLEYLFWNRVITKFRLVMPDPTHRTRTFLGFVKQLSETYPVAGVCTRNSAIRITTPMTDVVAAVSLTPPSASPAAAGGPGTIDVKAGGSAVAWTPTSTASWVTITTPTGPTTGDATVDYAVDVYASPTTPRTAFINIVALGLQFTITQAIV